MLLRDFVADLSPRRADVPEFRPRPAWGAFLPVGPKALNQRFIQFLSERIHANSNTRLPSLRSALRFLHSFRSFSAFTGKSEARAASAARKRVAISSAQPATYVVCAARR
jgi:hypothetical protein